jgi:hypothetical protein
MKGWFRQLTMILLVVSMSVLVESHMKASAAANSSSKTMLASCGAGHILCGGESIDYDAGTHGLGFPGAYIDSGNGTGRLGIWCASAYNGCYIYTAVYDSGNWYYTWLQSAGNGARHVWMNGNGNMQVFTAGYSSLLWQTNTNIGETDAYVNVHDDGCAAIWHEDDSSAFWNSCS